MVLEIIRYTVFGTFVAASLVSISSWAVRTRRISPFSRTARLVRRTTDPVLRPIERWLHRRGGNPQNAEWWLFGGAVGGGIAVIAVAGFLIDQFALVSLGVRAGPFAVIRLGVWYAARLVELAIFVRVIGSWFGKGRFTPYMRPAYWLTDWIIEPLRRVIPPLGMLDVTPIVAYFLVVLVVGLLI